MHSSVSFILASKRHTTRARTFGHLDRRTGLLSAVEYFYSQALPGGCVALAWTMVDDVLAQKLTAVSPDEEDGG